MDNQTDFDTRLLENFELFSSAAADKDNNVKAELYMYYAVLKYELFQRWGRTKDLEEAIEKGKWAVAETQEEHKEFAGRLNNLGVILEIAYKRTGKMEDLEEAILVARQAVDVTPKDHPDLAAMLNNLGNQLGCRYERTGKMEDLEEAILMVRQAVDVTPKDHPDLAIWLNNLGIKLESRYKRTGEMEDLEEAILVARQAIDMEDLEEAILVARQAIDVTPKDHPDLAGRLNNLGNKLKSRYERTGKIEDLEEAILVARQAVDVTPKDHPNLAPVLNTLGNQLESRYKRMGKMEDLEEAILMARQAVDVTPKDHLDLARRLNNLGNQLKSRYDRTGKMEDLEEAILVVRQAVDVTPKDHPDLAAMLNNLGTKLESRYERTGKMEDLEEAILVVQQAVDVTPKDHPNLAAMLTNLGNQLNSRYKHTGKMEDLEEATLVARQAVDITPKDHPDLSAWLNNLGNQLESRYKRTGKMEDLEETILVARQAVNVTPKDHPDLAVRVNNLGNRLERRYERTGKTEDLEKAIQVTQQAWECENAAPFIRVRASTHVLPLLQSQGDFESAYNISVEAINLLPYVYNRSLDRQDQQYVVSHFSGLATSACSLALQIGKGPRTALEVLEQGRGVILSLLMDDRSDTSKLKAAYPQLCEQYESLRLEVNKPAENITDNRTRKAASTRQIITKLEKCIRDIQQLPGFNQFHKGLTAKQMQSCSTEGSIVVVNVTNLRSDAVIVTTDAFKVLPLPRLSAHEARDWINQDLTTTPSSDRGRKNKAYLHFLSWLWRGCVRPVLDELYYSVQPSVEDLLRVWWIGTGLANSFPFHSAGDMSAGLTESTCYRAISSYTPTIKALQYARECARRTIPSCCDPWRAAIITMPKTPSAGDLPGTRAEKSEVITLEYPDVASAMTQLRECNIAHFACHGVSDPVDPSRSGLILQTARTSTQEPRQDILSVREVSQAHLSRAEIAYLSACSTAQNQAIRLSDEVLHVVNVAKSFYSELSQAGTARYSDDRAIALALHKAIVKIRESGEYEKRPLLWAQYVHFGA
ncbi:TPR-like protein [Cenococcum geophilum]